MQRTRTVLPSVLPLCSLCLWGATSPAPGAAQRDAAEWWRDAVFYEVFVRSFADSTAGPLAGDGVGDLRGLIERLDYLNDGDPTTDTDLGVTALWLMPIAESPSYHGYDVVDYRAVDEEYGTRQDFLDLIEAAHARGMRVIVDTVINHTSSRHPWFVEARDPESPRHAWYVWREEPEPADWGQKVWHDRAGNGLHYFGLFWHGMPDINLESAEATAAVLDFSRFWLEEMHADGFRLDAVKHLIERFPQVENTAESVRWLEEYRRAMHRADPEAFLIGEVWADTETVAHYVPEALDAAFEFDLAYAIVEGVRDGDALRIADTIRAVQRAYPPGQFATFLANHDMPRVMTTLLKGSTDRDEAIAKARLCAAIQLTLPGIPFVYYGEEIGMTGDKPDPDIRTPMQWTGDGATAGFTRGRPWRSPNADTPLTNVADQQADAASLLTAYRTLIHQRRARPDLWRSPLTVLDAGVPEILAYSYSDEGSVALFLHNLSGKAKRGVRVELPGPGPRGGHASADLAPWGSASVIVSE